MEHQRLPYFICELDLGDERFFLHGRSTLVESIIVQTALAYRDYFRMRRECFIKIVVEYFAPGNKSLRIRSRRRIKLLRIMETL